MSLKDFKTETEKIKERYSRRNIYSSKYDNLKSDVYLRKQELERAIIRWLNWKNFNDISDKKLIEIGCGSGANLLRFIDLGFQPKNLTGNELICERIMEAKIILPGEVELIEGDALELSFSPASFDIVFQSTVFTSILDPDFKKELAKIIWNFVKPDGGILWYDFLYDNPLNKDVEGIPIKKIKELFPEGKIKYWRLTLAPPISRLVTKIHPGLYSVFNIFPFLRTHILCWIEK